MPEYTAEITKNLLNGEWVISIRYVSGSVGERRRWSKFVLVPEHQGAIFCEVCETIEAAIRVHQDKGGAAVRPGYSHV